MITSPPYYLNKPHIRRDDRPPSMIGHEWICFIAGTVWGTGSGVTPLAAYEAFLGTKELFIKHNPELSKYR